MATLLDGDTVTHPEGRVYFYRLQAGRVTVTKSVLIVEVTSRAPPATLTLSGDSRAEGLMGRGRRGTPPYSHAPRGPPWDPGRQFHQTMFGNRGVTARPLQARNSMPRNRRGWGSQRPFRRGTRIDGSHVVTGPKTRRNSGRANDRLYGVPHHSARWGAGLPAKGQLNLRQAASAVLILPRSRPYGRGPTLTGPDRSAGRPEGLKG